MSAILLRNPSETMGALLTPQILYEFLRLVSQNASANIPGYGVFCIHCQVYFGPC
jgi:hypothetical protein